ncbi:uncharacterized protein LOC144663419 isoform X2 [Oculina patagonica]
MASKNRKKRQQNNTEDSGTSKQDLLRTVRKLEAQLAQEKFFYDKTKSEQQHEIKTLHGKVKSLERQKRSLLEKLEQNPYDQQTKMQSELNHTNSKLNEANQQLVTCKQQVEKLLRSNQEMKKSNEKTTEQLLDKIKHKNLKIKKLEPCETTQMWENWDDEIKQKEEKRRQRVYGKEFVASNGLEEKQQVEAFTVNFPFLYNGNKETEDKQDSNKQGVLKSESVPMNFLTNRYPETGFQEHIKEQEQPLKQICSDSHKTKDATQTQLQISSPNFKDITENNKGGTKSNIKEMELSSLYTKENSKDERPSSSIGIKNGFKGWRTTECESIKRLRNFYTRIGLGSKANAAEDITEECLQRSFGEAEGFTKITESKRPPPGFNTTDVDNGFAMLAGIDFPYAMHMRIEQTVNKEIRPSFKT